MGLCIFFGPQIREGCGHPMIAGANACYCAECGVKCPSKFDGCREVWAEAAPVPADFIERPESPRPGAAVASTNGAARIAAQPTSDLPEPLTPAATLPAVSVEAKAAMETELSELRAAFGSVERGLWRVEAKVAELESNTRNALDRHRDAIRTFGGRVKRLEQLAQLQESPRPPDPQAPMPPRASGPPA